MATTSWVIWSFTSPHFLRDELNVKHYWLRFEDEISIQDRFETILRSKFSLSFFSLYLLRSDSEGKWTPYSIQRSNSNSGPFRKRSRRDLPRFFYPDFLFLFLHFKFRYEVVILIFWLQTCRKKIFQINPEQNQRRRVILFFLVINNKSTRESIMLLVGNWWTKKYKRSLKMKI